MSATIVATSATLYAATPSTTEACTWLGHCLGDSCATNNDCDNDWICPNKVCVPCCETNSPASTELASPTTTTTPSSTTSPAPTSTTHRGLTKANIITISVAGSVGLVVISFAIFLIWRARRKRRLRLHPWNNPANTYGKAELDTTSPATGATKYRHEDQPPVEMPGSTTRLNPDAIELVELEGDVAHHGKRDKRPVHSQADEVYKPPIDIGQRSPPIHRLSPRSPRSRRFEEVVLPESVTLGQFQHSPVSDVSSSRPINHPPQPYRRRSGQEVEEPVFDNRPGSDSSYTLFQWPAQELPQRRGHG